MTLENIEPSENMHVTFSLGTQTHYGTIKAWNDEEVTVKPDCKIPEMTLPKCKCRTYYGQ